MLIHFLNVCRRSFYVWIPIYYLHVISSENDFCVRTSKHQWRQGFGFQCLGGLINENVCKEAMKHLKVQKHFRRAQSGDNHSTFKNILTNRQQEYTVFDQAVIPRNFWCCLQSTWNLQNWKKLMFAMTIIVVQEQTIPFDELVQD